MKSDLTHKQRRRRLDFAVLVKVLATASPDDEIKRLLNSVVQSIERRFGFTWEEKCGIVFSSIEDGSVSVREIHEQTSLREQEIKEIVNMLERNGRVRIHMATPNGGRPAKQIFPA
jgi:hypothetical protein